MMTIYSWLSVVVYFIIFFAVIILSVKVIRYYRNNPLSTDIPQVPKRSGVKRRKR